jgi:dihydrofolate synthase / folylpolyglutamate synthase
MPINNYEEALEFLYSQLPMYQRLGQAAFKKNLDNTLALCESACNPQDKLKSIHIAGTNGKGTVSHLLAGMCQLSGLKTGLYTSPHYVDYRERIRVDGQLMDKKYILDWVQKYREAIERIRPSFFEMSVVMAFSYFADNKVDIAVIETGLGGRLDSTNIILPILSVITNISYDHMDMLGDTLQAIAAEKAGIIKENVPVIIGERQDEVAHVFIDKAEEKASIMYFADELIDLYFESNESFTNTFRTVNKITGASHQIQTKLQGDYQTHNIRTALAAAYVLSGMNAINMERVWADFIQLGALTGYVGRWQILSRQPLVIADSAHNAAGIEMVLKMLSMYEERKKHFVLGFVRDKDISKILSLFPNNAQYYFCKANIPRGLPAGELKEKALEYGLGGEAYPSVSIAYNAALAGAGQDDVVFIGGSIFVVAEVL